MRAVVAALLVAAPLAAQQPTFVPDHADGIYRVGERVGWTVSMPSHSADGAYTWTVRRNGGTTIASGRLDLATRSKRIAIRAREPEMVLVEVKPAHPDSTFGSRGTGGPGRVLLGAAVAPTKIRAAEPPPRDFDAFWRAKLAQLAAIPMEAVVTPGQSNKTGVEYATVRLNNVEHSHVYGQIAKPARAGKFPALVIYQWASPPYPLQKSWVTDRAAEGWLVLNVEPHDVPGDMPQAFYDALPAIIKNYATIGQRSRDESYFLRMYLGDYRAVEYLASRPDWDGTTMVVMGTSMGGQQSFATAGLNPRVTAMLVNVPAGADVTAALHGRAPSYPTWNMKDPEIRTTARYFDAANFARHITAKSLVAMGFIDEVATPAGIWSAFNVIRGPKEAVPMVDSPHNNFATPQSEAEWTRRSAEWLDALVHGRDPLATRENLRSAARDSVWVATWTASPQLVEPRNMPPAPGLQGSTLRQVLHVSLGGTTFRVRLSNEFGNGPIEIDDARVARSTGGSAIDTTSDRVLTFGGKRDVSIAFGSAVWSDPFTENVAPLSNLALSMHVRAMPVAVTGHPGSRTTSFLMTGDSTAAAALPAAVTTEHWYVANELDARAPSDAAAIVALGNSITDGRGSGTNQNDRWPDNLARRLADDARTARIAVVNAGIGGNALLRGGLGPTALERLDRDVLNVPGAKWVIVLEGVNDIGGATAVDAPAVGTGLIAGFRQIIARAHQRGLRVYGATILPFGGSFYDTPERESAREAVNQWIRTSSAFDAVIDFDSVMRDPAAPTHLRADGDSGDHLHPNEAGYRLMADAVDLALFAR